MTRSQEPGVEVGIQFDGSYLTRPGRYDLLAVRAAVRRHRKLISHFVADDEDKFDDESLKRENFSKKIYLSRRDSPEVLVKETLIGRV